MSDLVKFLKSRIVEDEQRILYAPKNSDPYDADLIPLRKDVRDRLFDECSAKRRTIAFHESVSESAECGAGQAWAALNIVLREMAYPYRGVRRMGLLT